MSQYLGQHFLINKAAIKKIIAALDLSHQRRGPAFNSSFKSVARQKNETIIEIGPGKGALTLPLAEECQKIDCKIIAIEKDLKLVKNLEFRIENLGLNLKIATGDALKLLPNIAKSYIPNSKSWKLVGNIPYYITGKLLRIISELPQKPTLTVLTIQREVAERLTAPAGKMNLLAAAVQIWAKPKIIGYLKPNDFSPPPKIESAIIKLETNNRQQGVGSKEQENYYKLIKIVFKQPRKTLVNNLKSGLKISSMDAGILLKSLGLEANSRPQGLNVNTIIKLTEAVNKFL